jgi:hypothetical protein
VSAIRHDLGGFDWEASFFQVDSFEAVNGVAGVSHMVTDKNNAGFTVQDGRANYTSRIYNGELNMRMNCEDFCTVLVGFRMLQLHEQYLGSGMDVQSTSITDSLDIRTFNHMYGTQIGAEIPVYDEGGPLLISVLCKGGAFDNFAHENYDRVGASGGQAVTRSGSHGRNQAAFLGEVGVKANYAITERLSCHICAHGLWITGLAVAPEQIGAVDQSTNRYSINTSGATFYYGVGLGTEYRF